MPQYLDTLTQLGLKDLATQKGKGRVSSLSSISKQFFKTHYDGYHPRMSRHLATILKRYISTRPKHERRTSEFVGEIRRKLLCLHEYNVQIAKVKFKYPRSEQLDALLIQYIELECGLLYDSYKEPDERQEEEVRQRVVRLLKVILYDALHNSEVPLKTTIKACDKALLKLFASARVDYVSEDNLVAKVILKLLDKLSLLDEVNQLKGKNIPFHQDTFLRDPLVCTIRQNLTTSDYESDIDDSDEELDVASPVYDDMFNSSRKPYEQSLFSDGINKQLAFGRSNDRIKQAHVNYEPFGQLRKSDSSFSSNKTNEYVQFTKSNSDFLNSTENCDEIYESVDIPNSTNLKNTTHETDSRMMTMCSDVNNVGFPSDQSRNNCEQKTVKLVQFEETMKLSNNNEIRERNLNSSKENVSCSTLQTELNYINKPTLEASTLQEFNWSTNESLVPQSESLQATDRKSFDEENFVQVKENNFSCKIQNKENDCIFANANVNPDGKNDMNRSQLIQSPAPYVNRKITEQSELGCSHSDNLENFRREHFVQVREISSLCELKNRGNNWTSLTTDANLEHTSENHLSIEQHINIKVGDQSQNMTNQKPDETKIPDTNKRKSSVSENQLNSTLKVPTVVDTTQNESGKDEETTCNTVTIDLESMPDINGFRSNKTSVNESISNGLVTIEILDDDDDDQEADYTFINFNEKQSHNNVVLQTNEIKLEENEENHSPNFPILNSDKGGQNFSQSNNKGSRNSDTTDQNKFNDNSNTDGAKDLEIIISDSEDDSVEEVSENDHHNASAKLCDTEGSEDVPVLSAEITQYNENLVDANIENITQGKNGSESNIMQTERIEIEDKLNKEDAVIQEISVDVTVPDDNKSQENQLEVTTHVDINSDTSIVDNAEYVELSSKNLTDQQIDENTRDDSVATDLTTQADLNPEFSQSANSEISSQVTTSEIATEIYCEANNDVNANILSENSGPKLLEDVCDNINENVSIDSSHLKLPESYEVVANEEEIPSETQQTIKDPEEHCNNSFNDNVNVLNVSVDSTHINEIVADSPQTIVEETVETSINNEVVDSSQTICEETVETSVNIEEHEPDVYENVISSSDLSNKEQDNEVAKVCETTESTCREDVESVTSLEPSEMTNNDCQNTESLSGLDEETEGRKAFIDGQNSSKEIVPNSNYEVETNPQTDYQEKEVPVTEEFCIEAHNNSSTNNEVQELPAVESEKQNDQHEDIITDDTRKEEASVTNESFLEPMSQIQDNQTVIEDVEISETTTTENHSYVTEEPSAIKDSEPPAEEISDKQDVNEEQVITETPEDPSVDVNYINSSEPINQQNEFTSENSAEKNLENAENELLKKDDTPKTTYDVIDYSKTAPYTLPVSTNIAYNNGYVNSENQVYDIQGHGVEIYSMENVHQNSASGSVENISAGSEMQMVQVLQDGDVPQKTTAERTTINESFYYESNISSTLNEVEYVEYDTEKKVNLELLANIAVNQETLEVKNDSHLSDTTQDTPRRRKSKVRLDYKKKLFSRETLPRAVKQFPKKHQMKQKNSTEEVDDNRIITRNRIHKLKTNLPILNEIIKQPRVHRNVDSKYKPHDFISVENPTLPPPTNNVYAQKRLMETNTTSEDSNDSCESTLFIDLSENGKVAEKTIKSIFEEETIDDMLVFVSTEEKSAVCISIPENEENCISDSDSFQILKQIEDFVDNKANQEVAVSQVPASDQPDEDTNAKVSNVEDKTKELSSTLTDAVPQNTQDILNNSSVEDSAIKEDGKDNFDTKIGKTTDHSIENILNKTQTLSEVNVTLSCSTEGAFEESTPQIQNVETEKDIVVIPDNNEVVQENDTSPCISTTLQTFEVKEADNSSMVLQPQKSTDYNVPAVTTFENNSVNYERVEDNDQTQPENLTVNKHDVPAQKIEENSEKIFKTKAAMKSYEDKLQAVLPANLESDITSTTSCSKSPQRVTFDDNTFDKHEALTAGLNTSPISTTSFSSEFEISSDFNQSEEITGTQHEQVTTTFSEDISPKENNSVYDTAINLTVESLPKSAIDLTVESLPKVEQPRETNGSVENSPISKEPEVLVCIEKTVEATTDVSNDSIQEKPSDSVYNLEKPKFALLNRSNSITETSVIIDENIVITEVTCFKSSVQETKTDFGSVENNIQASKDEKLNEDNSKHEDESNTLIKSSPDKNGKLLKSSDEEKGRVLENTIKKMKEKIVESEKAKKDQNAAKESTENKKEEKGVQQKEDVHSIKDKSDKKHHKPSSKSSYSDDSKDKTNEMLKKDHKKRSRSPSKSRTSDKKHDSSNVEKEKSHHKESRSRSSSKSRSTDKRSKHSDSETDRKRRSKSSSIDEKEKNARSSDIEDMDSRRKDRSRSSSKSKSLEGKSKQITSDKPSSKHKSSDNKEKHNSIDDGKDNHKKRSSKSPSKSKTIEKGKQIHDDKKTSSDKSKSKDKSEISKSKSSSSKTDTKPKKDDASAQHAKDKNANDKIHEIHKTKSKDSSKVQANHSKPAQEKSSETHRKDEHVKNDKSRRSHSKEKTKVENSSRNEKREKSVPISKDRLKENSKKSRNHSEECKENESGSNRSKKENDKKSNNHSKENKENTYCVKKDKNLSDVHEEQKENSLSSIKESSVQNNFENNAVSTAKQISEEVHLTEGANKQKNIITDIPKKRKYDSLEENDSNINLTKDDLCKSKIPKLNTMDENHMEIEKVNQQTGRQETPEHLNTESVIVTNSFNNEVQQIQQKTSEELDKASEMSPVCNNKNQQAQQKTLEEPENMITTITNNDNQHNIQQQKLEAVDNENVITTVCSNGNLEKNNLVPIEITEEVVPSIKQNDVLLTESLSPERSTNIVKKSALENNQENQQMLEKENPLLPLPATSTVEAMDVDKSIPLLSTEVAKISNDVTNNNEISHISNEQDCKSKVLEMGTSEQKETEKESLIPTSKIVVQDATLPEISSSSIYVPSSFSTTSMTIDMQVLTSTTNSIVKDFHIQTNEIPVIPNVSVAAISTTTITSKEVPMPITMQSTPSCSTTGIQEKPCLFTFNADSEIVARENLSTTDLFDDAPIGLEDISPSKLPIGSNPSLDLIPPSTSISEISNSMNLVQTLGTSTINFMNEDNSEIDIQQTTKQTSFGSNFPRGTRVTKISCFVEKESTADHNYTLGDPLLGGNNEDKNMLTRGGVSLSNSPEEFQLNESHLEDLTFNENNFMEENGTLEDLDLLLPCKKEKPDFDNIIDDAIPKPEDIQNSIKHLNMLVDISQSGQQKTISVDNTIDHTTTTDCSVSLGIDYAVNKLLFLGGSEVTSQNNSFTTIPDIENMNIMEANVPSHPSKETPEDPISSIRSQEEPGSISSICTSYTNFMSADTNQKVVVEPVEQCIITSLDQLKKDYINDTSDKVEKSQPVSVTNCEPNIVKTSMPHKPSKFATFLQTVKRMDAHRNETPKVKDEMENYTIRRHNRTPVFPPKKKTATQQQHTKSPPQRKNEILSFETNVSKSQTTSDASNECRIRVKTDLMKPSESKSLIIDSFSSLDYINENDQNVASEVVLPFSRPSPSEKNASIDLKEKSVEAAYKVDGEVTKTARHSRFDKSGNDYVMENILNAHSDSKMRKGHTPELKVADKQIDNLSDSNKKRKSTVSDNSDTSDGEKYIKRGDKRLKKSDDDVKAHNKKLHDTLGHAPTSNDEIFDKLLAEGPVNKVFAQRMSEQQKVQPKSENSHSNVVPDVAKNRGYTTTPDSYKKAKVVPSPPATTQPHRENIRHAHPDSDKRRDQRKPGYYTANYNPPPDRRFVDKRHSTTGPVVESSPKRFIRNSSNPYSSKSDPCTSRGQPYKSRDRRSSTEQLNNLLTNKKEGSTVKDDDEFSWLTKLADTGVVDTPSNLFMPPGTKREDSSSRK